MTPPLLTPKCFLRDEEQERGVVGTAGAFQIPLQERMCRTGVSRQLPDASSLSQLESTLPEGILYTQWPVFSE